MRHVWGDNMVTLHIGGWLQLLLDSCWRVWKWSSNYGQVEQIDQIANCFRAENGCWGAYVDCISKYLKDIEVGVCCGGGLISCKSERTIIFQLNWRFSEKPAQSLIYWVARWDISKIYGVLCLIRDDLAFGQISWAKFTTFSVEGIETKYFEELILYLIEFYGSNGFVYLFRFFEIWNCCFYLIWPFENLGTWSCCFFGFLQWGVSNIFAWI